MSVDKFTDPILTPAETAKHLRIPRSTMYSWLHEKAAGEPLVHSVAPAKRGRPSVPFVAVIEAYVLRALREFHLPTSKIRAAAEEVRRSFDTPYGLATRRIATDGVDVFVHHLETDDLARAVDGQQPIREVIQDYLRYVVWTDDSEFPSYLVLPQFDTNVAQVVIDPRFGRGAPVEAATRTPVAAIVGMWRAGEPAEAIADDYGLERGQVEEILRVAA